MCRSTAQGGRRCAGHGSTSTATSTTPGGRPSLREALTAAGYGPVSAQPYLVGVLARRAAAVKDGRDPGAWDSEVQLGRAMLASAGKTDAQIAAIEEAAR